MDLLISPDGMLGRAWQAVLEARGRAFQTITYPDLDLTSETKMDAVEWSAFDRVINCAAWTDVDGAETAEEAATAVNGAGVRALAQRCKTHDATLLHYSTDYVFAGDATAPYPVDAPIAPVNAYGRSKAAGEAAIREVGARHLILRTSWLYAPWGQNFVLTMAKLGRSRDALRVVNDQRGRPTSAQHLAEASLGLVEAQAEGTFHVTDGGECTWFDFATAIVAAVNPNCVVAPCGSDEYPRPAKRPAYSVLDLGKTEAVVGPMPSWQENLASVLATIPA